MHHNGNEDDGSSHAQPNGFIMIGNAIHSLRDVGSSNNHHNHDLLHMRPAGQGGSSEAVASAMEVEPVNNGRNLNKVQMPMTFERSCAFIAQLVNCNDFEEIAMVEQLQKLMDDKQMDMPEKLYQMGNSVVFNLVEWAKRVPYYNAIPAAVHSMLLTNKWHELLMLTTSACQAIHGQKGQWSSLPSASGIDGSNGSGSSSTATNAINNGIAKLSIEDEEFELENSKNLTRLQKALAYLMDRVVTMDQVKGDLGVLVEKITVVIIGFRELKLSMKEYLCLKVIVMLNQENSEPHKEVRRIHGLYVAALWSYIAKRYPNQPDRFRNILVHITKMQSAASLLRESKFFYVPFLINANITT